MKKLVLGLGALVAGAIALAVTMIVATGASASPSDELQAGKAATARYHSYAQAVQDGYSIQGEPCVSAPPPPGLTGAMGIHAVNKELAGNSTVDPLHPDILLYLPDEDEKLELVGAEYFMVAFANTSSGPRPWFGIPNDPADPSRNQMAPPPLGFASTAPSVFGHTFDGPMPGHNPSMPWHHDLHVWFWADSPAGIFAPFNPALSCSQSN